MRTNFYWEVFNVELDMRGLYSKDIKPPDWDGVVLPIDLEYPFRIEIGDKIEFWVDSNWHYIVEVTRVVLSIGYKSSDPWSVSPVNASFEQSAYVKAILKWSEDE